MFRGSSGRRTGHALTRRLEIEGLILALLTVLRARVPIIKLNGKSGPTQSSYDGIIDDVKLCIAAGRTSGNAKLNYGET